MVARQERNIALTDARKEGCGLADEASCGSVVLLDEGWQLDADQFTFGHHRLSVDVVEIDVYGSGEQDCCNRIVKCARVTDSVEGDGDEVCARAGFEGTNVVASEYGS